jgi:hypothetical protein
VKKTGMTMPELTCLARQSGAAVDEQRADRTSLDALRAGVIDASGRDAGPKAGAPWPGRPGPK